jgi:hypothetical protein
MSSARMDKGFSARESPVAMARLDRRCGIPELVLVSLSVVYPFRNTILRRKETLVSSGAVVVFGHNARERSLQGKKRGADDSEEEDRVEQ